MKSMIAAGLSILALAASAAAQPAPGAGPPGDDMRALRRSARAACADDIARLCPDAASKDDQRTCMMQNRDKVSETCRSARAAMRQKMQSMGAQTPPPGGPNP